jgi:hypothetical protein
MPKDLEKIRKDIMKNNPKMKDSMAYALATNILKKRKINGVNKSKNSIEKSAAYKRYEKTESKDSESKESVSEKAIEYKKGMAMKQRGL